MKAKFKLIANPEIKSKFSLCKNPEIKAIFKINAIVSEQYVEKIYERIDEVQTHVDEANERIDDLYEVKADRTELEEAVNTLNEKDDNLQAQIKTKQDKLTSANAGKNINITTDSSGKVIISSTASNPSWGSIIGDINNQTDLKQALNSKADNAEISRIDNQLDVINETIISDKEELSTAIGNVAEDLEQTNNNLEALTGDVEDIADEIDSINSKIPVEATSENQLADKAYVDNSITDLDEFTTGTIVPSTTNFIEGVKYTIHEALQRIANLFAGFQGEIDDINDVIPTQASTQNQLADKAFVNATIQTNTANFRGNWATWGDVPTVAEDYPEDYAGSKTPTNNDYMVISDSSDFPMGEEPALDGAWRFIFVGDWTDGGKANWKPQYRIGSAFTEAQQKAIDSGITSELVAQIETNQSDIGDLQTDKVDKIYTANKVYGTNSQGAQSSYEAGTDIEFANGKINFTRDEDINTAQTDISNLQTNKQDKLTPGTGISITNNTISNTYTSLDNYTTYSDNPLNLNNTFIYKTTDGTGYKRGDFRNFLNTFISPTYATKLALTEGLNTKQNKLTAGTGIKIENNVISNTQTSAEWGNITGNIQDQADLKLILDNKQNKLTPDNAGDNITITYSSGASVLPEGYTQYNYMESSSTQVVNAGTVSNGEWVEIVFSPTVISGSATGSYTGVAGMNSAPQMGYYPGGWTAGNASSPIPYLPEIGNIYTYKWTSIDGRFYIDDIWTNLGRSGTLTLNLFQCEGSSKPSRIYEVRKYDRNNQLVLHLYPASEDSTYRNGMYDIVNNVFYPSNLPLIPGDKIQGEDVIISADLSTVEDELQNVREVAEGKTKSYVVSYADNPIFNSQDAEIKLTDVFIDINGNTHNIDELKLGDNIFVQETDVPDRWCGNIQYITPAQNTNGNSTQTGIPTPSNPIPVVSTLLKDTLGNDVELRNIEDYVDSYQADTTTLIKNVGIKVFDGTEAWQSVVVSSGKVYYNGSILEDKLYGGNLLYCNYFLGTKQSRGTLANGEVGVSNTAQGSNQICFRYDEMETANDFKQWVKEKYDNNTPLILYYKLATPVTEVKPLYLSSETGIVPLYKLETSKIDLTEYATKTELADKVGFTDYASGTKAGIVKINNTLGMRINSYHELYADVLRANEYASYSNNTFISKGTLENIKESLVTSVGDTKYQPIGDYATKTELATKQNITDNNLVTTDKTVVGAVNELDAKIKEIELFKAPNVLIVGDPTINNGQVTNLSKTNYLILPFEFDVKDRAFELTYCFRTGTDVTTAQNLFGSKFSIASYISGGKLTVRVSSNGTSWNVLDLETSLQIQPNTTYYIKLIFNKLSYEVKASTDGVEYSQIGYVVNPNAPFAGDVYIGIGNNQNNPFLGMINLHKWELKYNNYVFWEGMDDAGLATRADISLSNLDEIGQAKFDAKQDVLVSGQSIKTLNNQSLLGSGNINITSAQWGSITGTLNNQTDLKNALDNKTQVIIRRW